MKENSMNTSEEMTIKYTNNLDAKETKRFRQKYDNEKNIRKRLNG